MKNYRRWIRIARRKISDRGEIAIDRWRISESQRDSGPKPRVGAQRLPWVRVHKIASTPKALWQDRVHRIGHNRVAVERFFLTSTQGSSFLATLGWRTQSFQD